MGRNAYAIGAAPEDIGHTFGGLGGGKGPIYVNYFAIREVVA